MPHHIVNLRFKLPEPDLLLLDLDRSDRCLLQVLSQSRHELFGADLSLLQTDYCSLLPRFLQVPVFCQRAQIGFKFEHLHGLTLQNSDQSFDGRGHVLILKHLVEVDSLFVNDQVALPQHRMDVLQLFSLFFPDFAVHRI